MSGRRVPRFGTAFSVVLSIHPLHAMCPDHALALLGARLGAVLHFLCTGMSLFHMDVDDNVTPGGPEEARLRAWGSEHLVGSVFAKAAAGELEDADIAAAQDLLRWCLQRDPAKRPQSMVQVRTRGGPGANRRFPVTRANCTRARCHHSANARRCASTLVQAEQPRAFDASRRPYRAVPSGGLARAHPHATRRC